MNDSMRKTSMKGDFLPGVKIGKETELWLYERPFSVISQEVLGLDLC